MLLWAKWPDLLKQMLFMHLLEALNNYNNQHFAEGEKPTTNDRLTKRSLHLCKRKGKF